MTDREVIAAIRKCHLKANIAEHEQNPVETVQWGMAVVDPGGSGLYRRGPYLKVSVTSPWNDQIIVRVYPPARLRRKLRKALGWDQ